MDKSMLRRSELRVYEFVSKSGATDIAHLKSRGMDVRAANSLVKCGFLTLTKSVYQAVTAVESSEQPDAKTTVANATGRCLCGCGAELGPKRRFAQGHDAKLHSIVLRVARGQAVQSALPADCSDNTSATVAYLRGAPWMTDEIREAIGL